MVTNPNPRDSKLYVEPRQEKFLVAAIIATIVTATLVIYLIGLNQEAEIGSILAN
jgi:hypothetical protein